MSELTQRIVKNIRPQEQSVLEDLEKVKSGEMGQVGITKTQCRNLGVRWSAIEAFVFNLDLNMINCGSFGHVIRKKEKPFQTP